MYEQDTGQAVRYASAAALWMDVLIQYQSQVAAVRLCPIAAQTNSAAGQGTASLAWSWGSNPDPKLNTGSYAINGWLYKYDSSGAIATYITVNDAPKFFQKESAITRTAETPTFCDAIWPDMWPKITGQVANNLSTGDASDQNGFGRCSISRHPLKAGTTTFFQPVPGAINMAFADGHAAYWKLQNIKNVVWHVGFTPNANPWATSP